MPPVDLGDEAHDLARRDPLGRRNPQRDFSHDEPSSMVAQ
jgi:hypothetical protein